MGPLSGTAFAAKDLFDVEGRVSGCGNPDWARTHPPATETAPSITSLLGAGGRLIGMTIMDELAYSLSGQNVHYGTPVNAAAPGRIAGGSSCGSASAVAAGLCDFALGTDTGGSVRVPASYCGLYGVRPTHGRISLAGAMPLAPSFDTLGWFARDAATLRRVGVVLSGEDSRGGGFHRLLVATDAFALADPEVKTVLEPLVEVIGGHCAEVSFRPLGNGDFGAWMQCFRIVQAHEIWREHGAWITKNTPRFGPEIGERFKWASTVTDAMAEAAMAERRRICRHLEATIPEETVVVMPTAPGIAPLVNASGEDLADHRSRVLAMTAAAGLAGLPQISVPAARGDHLPVGLSFLGARGSDSALLAWIEQLGLTERAPQ
jgi:amidase